MFRAMGFFSVTFAFYKQFLWVSILLNLILLGLRYEPAVIVFVKIFLGIVLWGYYKTEKKMSLIFFHNLRINSIRLLLTCFLYDLLVFLLSYSIFIRFI